MRKFRSDEEQNIKTFTENSVELTVIEPTRTGLEKGIMDATGPVRNFFEKHNLHDYSSQGKGQENKILIKAYLVYPDKLKSSIASLYRPVTKKGDPRIWFKGLTQYCEPNDILGIIVYNKELFVINLTKFDVRFIIENLSNNPLKELIEEIRNQSEEIPTELIKLLTEIAKRGPIKALLNADTAIGRTLEHLLGITINSSKSPDYKGIELKSYRDKRDNRKTLFAQVPDWGISKFKSSAEILDNFGYWREKDFKLYCTVSAFGKNSQGLRLKVDQNKFLLTENSIDEKIGDFVHWPLSVLHKRLLEKHNETFWISAESILIDNNEYFHFKKVEHTKKPITSQFDILLDQGLVTVDHLIKRTEKGKVVEKGPLFKIQSKALNLLFPPSQIYKLI
ncbi:MAG: hypothetical protein K9G42_05165 [Pedobacter sp.]|nr:hypothetical protein [Pedobacter sp.]